MTENPGNRPPQYDGNGGAPQYGQNPQGGAPQYGQGGQNPQQYGYGGAPQAAPERPQAVRNGVLLIYISAALSLVGAVISVFTVQDSEQMQEVRAQTGSDAAMTAGIVIGIVVSVVVCGLYALFGWFAGKGRNWARIVLLVLAILTLLGLISQIMHGSFVGIATSIIFLVGTALLWFGPGGRWFQALKLRQYQQTY